MMLDKLIVLLLLLISRISSYCFHKQTDKTGRGYCSCDRAYKKQYYQTMLCQTVFNFCAYECSTDINCLSFNIYNDNTTCYFFNTNNCLTYSLNNCFNYLAQGMVRSMFVTADNSVKQVFIDGVDHTLKVGTRDDWKGLGQFYYPFDARVIAVHSYNIPGGDGGLLARSTDGYVSSDTMNWRCINYTVRGWEAEDFNDSNWPLAHEVVDVKSSSSYNYIHAGSKWIWSEDSTAVNVYCRSTMKPYRNLRSSSDGLS